MYIAPDSSKALVSPGKILHIKGSAAGRIDKVNGFKGEVICKVHSTAAAVFQFLLNPDNIPAHDRIVVYVETDNIAYSPEKAAVNHINKTLVDVFAQVIITYCYITPDKWLFQYQ